MGEIIREQKESKYLFLWKPTGFRRYGQSDLLAVFGVRLHCRKSMPPPLPGENASMQVTGAETDYSLKEAMHDVLDVIILNPWWCQRNWTATFLAADYEHSRGPPTFTETPAGKLPSTAVSTSS